MLIGGRNLKCLDELADGLLRDGVAASQVLELFVGIRYAAFPHDRLDRLCHHFPGLVEIGRDDRCVELQLADAFQGRRAGELRVAQGDTHVAQDRGVTQVALQARNGKLR